MENKVLRVVCVIFFIGLAVFVAQKIAKRPPGELIHQDRLGKTGFRFEVFETGISYNIMPGSSSSGEGVVRVFNRSDELVFERAVESTLSDVFVFEEVLVIAGEGTWPLNSLKAVD